METYHRDLKADLTIAAYPVPRAEAHAFGVIQVDADGRITGFQEKPKDPTPIPGQPDTCLVSMGNYFFRTKVLERALRENDAREDTHHDFGKDIIPALLAEGALIYAYDFRQNQVPGDTGESQPYWRDVGTTDSYFKASMELRGPVPSLNLYNRKWRIRTAQRNHPPARFIHRDGHPTDLDDCMVCEGSVVAGGRLRESLIGYDCSIWAGAQVEGSMLLSGCDIGRGATIRGVLADKNCAVDPGAQIGCDPELDRQRFPFITAGGIIVLPKGTRVPVEGPIEFAQDIGALLKTDAATKDAVAATAMAPVIGDHRRHSYRSAGPGSNRSS
jgi:glucose-1-phosphate adenylyltransferase